MTDEKQSEQPERPDESAQPDPDAAWKRKRRRAEIFGDALPDVTRDERDPAGERGGKGDDESASDAWLKSQVPPHHG